ncbi:ABC transporter substrate-binding protein, partial [Rhodococcus erythropolis]
DHLRREVPDATGVEIFAEGASDPNFEYISTLGADLLVLSAGWWDTGSYGNDRMQQIAPVLPVGKDFTPEWRKVMSDFLTGIGRSDRAEEVLAEYDAHVAQVRPTVEPLMAGKKVAFVAAAEDQIAWFQNDFRTAVAEDLGFEVLRDGPDLRVMLGSEQFNRLEEADVIFALDRSASGSVYTSPTWQRLPAAQAGRVIPFDYYKAAGYALTAKVLVDDLAAGVKR